MILHNIKNRQKDDGSGFTIVELLVVIVVIGILAAITIVSYTGVTAKANTATNKSNAESVMKSADAYFAENGSYPTQAQLTAYTTVKVPGNFTITNAAAGSTNPGYITYNPSTAPATNYCIEYYDTSTPAKVTLVQNGTGTITCP
jgi:prepilin-type N-terminal cleavage/methylation domain-containing protein